MCTKPWMWAGEGIARAEVESKIGEAVWYQVVEGHEYKLSLSCPPPAK